MKLTNMHIGNAIKLQTKKIRTIPFIFLAFTLILLQLSPLKAHASTIGSLGNWQATTSLPQEIKLSSSVTYNGYIYEIGGYNQVTSTYLSTVYYAPISANGTVGAWQTTTPLPYNTTDTKSVVNNGYIYEIGGEYSTAVGIYQRAIYYAPINANGTIGTWSTTTAMPSGIGFEQVVVNNGYVYIMGGVNNSGSYLATVYYASINANGTIGTWSTTTALPLDIRDATSVVNNGYVYIMGGGNNSTSVLSTVYYASINTNGTVGTWNTTSALPQGDFLSSSVEYNGYIYELGGSSQTGQLSSVDYAQTLSSTPNTPSSLGPTASTNGTYSNNNTPTFSFSLSDTDPTANVQYEIQVANNSSFTSPLIDYTSALGSQGGASFSVGQAAGSGKYTTGLAGQTLPDGNYYWRVQTIGSSGIASGYTTANSGSIAFKVDTTAPTVPGTPTTSLASTTNTSPTWNWTASTDSGSGLAATPYTIEWSTSSTFASNVSSTTSKTNSIVLPVILTPGTWYVRVKAVDAVGNMSSYSSLGSVTITAPPPSPISTPTKSTTTTTAVITNPTKAQQNNITTNSVAKTFSSSQTVTTPTPSTSTTTTPSKSIVLNNYSSYTTGTGKQENMSSGQVAYFNVGNQTHTATIDKVGGDYVTLTLRSTPQTVTIRTGATDEYNVTGSGKSNISITLLGTINGKALLSFAAVTTLVVHVVTASSKNPSSSPKLIFILIVLAIGLVTGVWLMWRHKLHSRAGK